MKRVKGLYFSLAVILLGLALTHAQTSSPSPPASVLSSPTPATDRAILEQAERRNANQDEAIERLMREQEYLRQVANQAPARDNWYNNNAAEQITFLGLLVSMLGAIGSGIFLSVHSLYKSWGKHGQIDFRNASTMEILNHYHTQALEEHQANRRATLGVALIGVGIIFLGGLLAFMGAVSIGTVTAISGVLSEAVAGFFFHQTGKSLERVKEIEDKLYTESLLNKLSDPSRADDARIQIATRRVGALTGGTTNELPPSNGSSTRSLPPARSDDDEPESVSSGTRANRDLE